MRGAKKYFVGGDSHVLLKHGRIAGVDKITNNAVVKFLENEGPWDGYIHLGDLFDMNVISSFSKTNLRGINGEDLIGQYRAGNAYMEQHAIASGCLSRKFTLIEGNHENRVERYIDAHPELDGVLNLKHHLSKEVNPTWIPFWTEHEIWTVGKATFIHGIGSAHRQNEAALRDYGTNVFMGHSHTMDSATLRYFGNDSTKVAHSLGCLCEYGQPYLRNRPTRWIQGFAVFYFWPDGRFNYFPVHINDHAFISPSGKFYNGKKDKPDTQLVLK